jgi:hypothetical protein
LQLGLLTAPQGVHFGPDQPHQVKVMYSMMDDLASVVTDGASVKAVDKIASQVAASAGSKAPGEKGAQLAWEKQRSTMLQVTFDVFCRTPPRRVLFTRPDACTLSVNP